MKPITRDDTVHGVEYVTLAEANAAREADMEAMRMALNALIAVRDAIPDLHSYRNFAGNTLGSRVDAAIKALEQRVGES